MKKKKSASKLLSFFLAITMALTLMPAISAKAEEKLGTPTNVKISLITPKHSADYYREVNVSWSKVSGASMYAVSLQERRGNDKQYYGSSSYYADGKDTSLKFCVNRSDKPFYIKVTVTALGNNFWNDGKASKLSNMVKIPKSSKARTIYAADNYFLNYDDNCGYAKWEKGFYRNVDTKKGKTLTVRKGPARKGCKFLYWIDQNGKKYEPGDKYKITTQRNYLYAIWQVGDTEVKTGSGESLTAPTEVKLTAEPYYDDSSSDPLSSDVMFHASWSKVDGAYGYLLYLDNDWTILHSTESTLESPFVVLGENTTSYDFSQSWLQGSYALAVRPMTEAEFKSFSKNYKGKNYSPSESIKINNAEINNNYSIYSKRAYSPEAIKFTTKSETLKDLTSAFVPSGKKLSYWWDLTTRKKLKNGDKLEGVHDIYAIWK